MEGKKICTKCSVEQLLSNFNKCKDFKDGLKYTCKSCDSEYRFKNRERINKNQKETRINNRSEILVKEAKRRNDNKEKINKKHTEWLNKDNNREKKNKRDILYFKKNKEKLYKQRKNKRLTDLNYKLTCNIRSLIGNSIARNGYTKNSKTATILGCSFEDFKSHIESLWKPWMNWDNYGNPKDGIYELNKTLDIDHIIPHSVANSKEEVIKLNKISKIDYKNAEVPISCNVIGVPPSNPYNAVIIRLSLGLRVSIILITSDFILASITKWSVGLKV